MILRRFARRLQRERGQTRACQGRNRRTGRCGLAKRRNWLVTIRWVALNSLWDEEHLAGTRLLKQVRLLIALYFLPLASRTDEHDAWTRKAK
jgi:hypothetical protein